MNAVQLALIAVLLPVAVALFLLVAAPVRRAGWPAAALSLGGAIGSLIASVWLLWRQTVLPERALLEQVTWLPEAGSSAATIGVLVDGVSASMLVVVALVATCVQVFSVGYMASEPKHDFGRYFTWHSLFLFSMQGLVLAPNLLQLFVCWELVGLCSYLLIGFYWQKGSAGKAAVKAFWVTKLADTGLLLGLIVQYSATGSFGWGPETVTALQAAGVALPAVGLLYFLAVMGKSAQFPLHVWLPDAMEGPTPVSALLHAATMVAAGVYLVVRAYPIFAASEAVMMTFGVVGGFTAIFAACVAVVQTDIKKVLAYSTCSQLGYMVAALGTGSFMAGYLHLTTHAFFKALLFLAAGSAIHAVHSNELKDMGGLARRMPVTGAAFVIGCLALAGVPLLSGFYSKDMVLESLLHAAQDNPVFWFPLVTCTASAGITAYYMGKAAVLAFFGKPSAHAEHAHESGPSMALPLIVLALPAVGAGWMTGVLAGLWGVPDVHFAVVHFAPIGIVATVLALGGLAVAWIKHAQGGLGGLDAALAPLGALARSGLVDQAWDTAWRRGVLVASAGLAWFDRYVVDGLMNVTGVGFLEAGTAVRRVQTGRASDYLWAISLGILLLAVYSQARMWVG